MDHYSQYIMKIQAKLEIENKGLVSWKTEQGILMILSITTQQFFYFFILFRTVKKIMIVLTFCRSNQLVLMQGEKHKDAGMQSSVSFIRGILDQVFIKTLTLIIFQLVSRDFYNLNVISYNSYLMYRRSKIQRDVFLIWGIGV